MDVATAAHLAEIPLDEFSALNPAYSRPIMLGSNDSPLVLPADKVAVFRTNLQQQQDDDKPLSLWKTYALKKGEKLDAVAARSGITLARLKQLNGITRRTKVRAGFNILIPNSSAVGSSSTYLLSSLPQTPEDPPKAATTAKRHGKHKGAVAKPRKHVSGKRAAKPSPKKKKTKGN